MPRVEVVRVDATAARVVGLELAEGTTLEAAAAAAGLVPDAAAGESLGVFGERRDPRSAVRDGDRIELYRPLPLDPREMRRRAAGPRRR